MSGPEKLLYMCCSGREVQLTLLQPLKSHPRLRNFLGNITKHNFCFVMMFQSVKTAFRRVQSGYLSRSKTYWRTWVILQLTCDKWGDHHNCKQWIRQPGHYLAEKKTNFREWQRHRRPVTPCHTISPSGRENITATSLCRLILEQEFLSVKRKYLPYTFVFNRMMEQVRNINHIVQWCVVFQQFMTDMYTTSRVRDCCMYALTRINLKSGTIHFTVHIKHPTVVRLTVLLENHQHIYVAEDSLHQTVKHYSDSLTFSVHNITLPYLFCIVMCPNTPLGMHQERFSSAQFKKRLHLGIRK
jgi:hypothetical protein